MSSRRIFLKQGVTLAVAGISYKLAPSAAIVADETSSFSLPPLPYAYDALEPFIDKATMELHHDKHHRAYVNNLNKALQHSSAGVVSLEEILMNVSKYDMVIRNNAGGHYNHSRFWEWMKPGGGGAPAGKLADAINSAFGGFDEFKKLFSEAALKHFGSGWAWLVENEGKLQIGSTANQDNPIMDISPFKGKPLLGLDVWEHAYYLKYQNKRIDYINNWWNTLNWDKVASMM